MKVPAHVYIDDECLDALVEAAKAKKQKENEVVVEVAEAEKYEWPNHIERYWGWEEYCDYFGQQVSRSLRINETLRNQFRRGEEMNGISVQIPPGRLSTTPPSNLDSILTACRGHVVDLVEQKKRDAGTIDEGTIEANYEILETAEALTYLHAGREPNFVPNYQSWHCWG